jgi:CRISPR-associated protein Cmr3
MTLQTWIIEPRDSLIVRDGKPFGANITHATSLDFPFPSTTTGGVRTRIGLNQNGIFSYPQNRLAELTNIEVRGALLAELDDRGEIKEFYLPSPADALLLQDERQKEKKEAQLYRLLPLDLPDAKTNLQGLLPVGLNRTDKKDKPCDNLKFWTWKQLKKWLKEGEDSNAVSLAHWGIESLKKDSRTHVAINDKFASDEGNLFQTRGLEFNYGNGSLSNAKKLALVIFVDDGNSQRLENKGRLAPLGGERRLVSWRKANQNKLSVECPKEIKEKITRHCRLMLLTPAYFDDIFSNPNRTNFEVKAIASNRYQTVSGWDFETNQPKPTRRLVPAGSMLFVEIKTDVEQFINNTWFHCIGDDAQAKKDGFGLCILGTWDGKPLDKWSDEK